MVNQVSDIRIVDAMTDLRALQAGSPGLARLLGYHAP